ncbi:MAG TPA: hypothetical protein VK856_11085, partial [Anaerolineaceae bacterium]|nr:hypothetical protein [Anaerolineaceae bacterium]
YDILQGGGTSDGRYRKTPPRVHKWRKMPTEVTQKRLRAGVGICELLPFRINDPHQVMRLNYLRNIGEIRIIVGL